METEKLPQTEETHLKRTFILDLYEVYEYRLLFHYIQCLKIASKNGCLDFTESWS